MTQTQQDPAILRLAAGRAAAVEMQPYLGTALHAIKPVKCAHPNLPTLGVDKFWRMYWNPEFILTLSVEECAGAWLHEVGHLLRDHSQRFEATGEPRNRHPLWNKAGDAAINADLREANVSLPAIKAIYPEIIPGAKPGMTTEQMYRLILDTPEAEKVAAQKEQLLLAPNTLLSGKVVGQRIIGITRAGFLDGNDFTVTVTDANETPAAIRDEKVHDKRTLDFTLDADLDPGKYLVSVTSGPKTVTATLTIVSPSVSFRPDHITRGWTAPYKVTAVGRYTEFTTNAQVAVTDADGATVAVTNVQHVSKGYLNFDIAQQVADGLYTVTITDGFGTVSDILPIGLPFMDISPASLPVGHGTPYPFAAVVDDFAFDQSTTFELAQPLMGALVPMPGALSGVVVKTSTTADFTLTESLDEGVYLVVATTNGEQVYATLSVSNDSGDGEGDGDGDDDSDGGEGGEGGEGQDKSDGDGDGDSDGQGGSGKGSGKGGSPSLGDFDDCGSGSGGDRREWEDGNDTSDGAVDEGRGNLIREQVARQIQEHQKTRGTVPGGWSRWADTILKPQVDWRKELRSVVRRTIATVAGMRDYTYQRPSRRAGAVPNVVLPAMRAPRPPQVAAVVDTSGSVSDRMLGQAIGDMNAMLKQIRGGGGEDFKLIACDAAAAEMKSVRDMKNLTALDGGGGTDMRVGMEAAAALVPKMDLIVVFTDGETPWPEEPPRANPRAKYVAVLLAGEPNYADVPEWMHKITIDDAYLRNSAS